MAVGTQCTRRGVVNSGVKSCLLPRDSSAGAKGKTRRYPRGTRDPEVPGVCRKPGSRPHSLREGGFCMRARRDATMGTVSMVLATAMSSRAVKVSPMMICLVSRTSAKMIMIRASV